MKAPINPSRRRLSSALKVAAVGLFVLTAILTSCQEATQITVQLSTDRPAERELALYAWTTTGSTLKEDRFVEKTWSPGALVFTPNESGKEAELTVRVAIGPKGSAAKCFKGSPECASATGKARFQPGRNVDLPISIPCGSVCGSADADTGPRPDADTGAGVVTDAADADADAGVDADADAHVGDGDAGDGDATSADACGDGGRYSVISVPPGAGCPASDGLGIVRDNTTGLYWMARDYAPTVGTQTWNVANAECARRGMRLPTRDEAEGIHQLNRAVCAFPCPWNTWTSTPASDGMCNPEFPVGSPGYWIVDNTGKFCQITTNPNIGQNVLCVGDTPP